MDASELEVDSYPLLALGKSEHFCLLLSGLFFNNHMGTDTDRDIAYLLRDSTISQDIYLFRFLNHYFAHT